MFLERICLKMANFFVGKDVFGRVGWKLVPLKLDEITSQGAEDGEEGEEGSSVSFIIKGEKGG